MDMVLEVDIVKLKSNLLDGVTKDIKARISSTQMQDKVSFKKGELLEVEQNELELEMDLSQVPADKKIELGKLALGSSYKSRIDVTESTRNLMLLVPAIGYKIDDAVERAIEIIRNRIDDLGLANVVIKREGTKSIRIQLPGIADPEQARNLIGQTAMLEFKLVKNVLMSDKYRPAPDEEVLPGVRYFNKMTQQMETPFYVLKKETLLTGDTLKDARVGFDQFNRAEVLMDFNAVGTKSFGDITAENIQRRLAIVLDGKVQQAPVIQTAIYSGSARITGYDTLEDAKRIAIVLRNGALPAPVQIAEDRTVGPTLGKESVAAGTKSIMIGFILVLIYMIFYYKVSGFIANLALLLNLLLVMAALAMFGASLTLPGIAGILLTIGMSVDANVIIYERIKEELKSGKSIRASVDAGFAKAFSAIIDANVTTLITAAVLYWQGSGAIKGFAVTLAIGIIASMFTALFCVRTVLDYMTSAKDVKKLSI
jgi:preprotein translocase subunit SecD